MLKKFFTFICYTIIISALLVQLAIFLARTNFFFELFTHYAVYYAILWPIFALFCITQKHWKSALVLLALASTSIAQISPYFHQEILDKHPQNLLTILSQNFYYKNDHIDEFLTLITDANPTVFTIQEAGEIWKDALSKIAETYPYLYLSKTTGARGILMASKLPGTFKEVPLGNAFGVELTLEGIGYYGATVKVLAVHPEAPIFQSWASARNAQFEDIASYVKTTQANSTQTELIIVGDFNCTPWSPYFKDLLDAGLTDSALGKGLISTWHSGIMPLKISIDHVLTTDGLSTSFFQALHRLPGADHLPIEAGIY